MQNHRMCRLAGVLLATTLGLVMHPLSLVAAETSIVQLRAQITEQETTLADLRQRLKQAEEQRHKLELQEYRIGQQIAQLGENPVLQSRIAAVRGELQEVRHTVAALDQERKAAEGRLAKLKGALRQQDTEAARQREAERKAEADRLAKERAARQVKKARLAKEAQHQRGQAGEPALERTIQQPTSPTLQSSLTPEMVLIKGGCFQMGSPSSEGGRGNDEQQHRICVEDFFLAKYEVTVGEFRRFVDAKGYRTDADKGTSFWTGCYAWNGFEWQLDTSRNWRNPRFPQEENHPVVCVSWNDAVAYADWLSEQTGQRYRLPTEAEWEYAARAGTGMARYWGEDWNQACEYANVADQTLKTTFPNAYPWTSHGCSDGYLYTAPAGQFKPNAWGLYDMFGNVLEWTCSAYDRSYGGAESQCSDKDTTSTHRVVRSSGWYSGPSFVRSAIRFQDYPHYRYITLGFRLAKSL